MRCVAYSSCAEGRYISSLGSTSQDRQCGDCDGVTSYSVKSDVEACSDVTDCGLGLTEDTPPTPTSDRKCKACEPLTYKDYFGNAACTTCTKTCKAGQYIIPCTGSPGQIQGGYYVTFLLSLSCFSHSCLQMPSVSIVRKAHSATSLMHHKLAHVIRRVSMIRSIGYDIILRPVFF